MKVAVLAAFVLAACFAVISAGPSPYGVQAQQADHYSNQLDLPYYCAGRMIYVYGKSPSYGGFNIDITPQYDDDVHGYGENVTALRLGVRFETHQLIRNSYRDGKWGYEENDGYLPLLPRQYFMFTITVQTYGYAIGIDGYHITTFYHRVPITKNMRITVSEEAYGPSMEYY